jgi:hypothetical protein
MKIHSTQLVWELTPLFNPAAQIVQSPKKAEIDKLCHRLSGFSTHKCMEVADLAT